MTTTSIFTAELDIPAIAYMPPRSRFELPAPEQFGLIRGYFTIATSLDRVGNPQPTGYRLIAEFLATNITEAEDKALLKGAEIATFIAFMAGSPTSTPILRKVAKQGVKGGLIQQHDYFYIRDSSNLGRVAVGSSEIKRHLSRLSKLPERVRAAAELGARWYGMSVANDDPLDKYLSVWIGLESIGGYVSDKVHSAGTRARCPVCKNPSGVKRNDGEAGTTHMMLSVAPELLATLSLQSYKDIRNNIAHALESTENSRAAAVPHIPDLQLVLGSGILTLLARYGTSSPNPGTWSAALPRDYEARPDLRYSFDFGKEIPNLQPFFGDWAEVNIEFPNLQSRIEPTGQYILGSGLKIEFKATVIGISKADISPNGEAVMFERLGVELVDVSVESQYEDLDETFEYKGQLPTQPWRPVELSPAWKRHFNKGKPNPN